MTTLSRRSVLGSVGVVVGAGAVAGLPSAAAAAAPFVVHGSALRRLGQRRPVGAVSAVCGSLHLTPGGATVGDFFASSTVLAEHRMLEDEVGDLETQLFRLADGTLTGVGTVRHDGSGEFTITGGTGAYAGAQGSYRSVQSADRSGGGEAVFTFMIGSGR